MKCNFISLSKFYKKCIFMKLLINNNNKIKWVSERRNF